MDINKELTPAEIIKLLTPVPRPEYVKGNPFANATIISRCPAETAYSNIPENPMFEFLPK